VRVCDPLTCVIPSLHSLSSYTCRRRMRPWHSGSQLRSLPKRTSVSKLVGRRDLGPTTRCLPRRENILCFLSISRSWVVPGETDNSFLKKRAQWYAVYCPSESMARAYGFIKETQYVYILIPLVAEIDMGWFNPRSPRARPWAGPKPLDSVMLHCARARSPCQGQISAVLYGMPCESG
jgi:hypothetical protein